MWPLSLAKFSFFFPGIATVFDVTIKIHTNEKKMKMETNKVRFLPGRTSK